MLSEKTKELLRKAGWDESGKCDTAAYEEALKAEGYPVPGCVKSFLRSFGGLEVSIPPLHEDGEDDDFLLDPLQAIDRVYVERVSEEYSVRVGLPLCVIGLYHRGHMVLLMDTEGGVYGGYDDTLVRFASCGEDALEALCRNAPVTPIPPFEEDRA